jgi:hypothetical protein
MKGIIPLAIAFSSCVLAISTARAADVARAAGRLVQLDFAPTQAIGGASDILLECEPGTFNKVCGVATSVTLARISGDTGLPPLILASSGTYVAVDAEMRDISMSVDAMVNGAKCPLSNGVNLCAIPPAIGTELHVTLHPGRSGAKVQFLASAILRVRAVSLHRGFERVLEAIRADAQELSDSLEALASRYERTADAVRYSSRSRSELQRIFDAYVFPGGPLEKYNSPLLDVSGAPLVDAFGQPIRDAACPRVDEAAPDDHTKWSHSIGECTQLAAVATVLNGEAGLSQSDVDALASEIRAQAAMLELIVRRLDGFADDVRVRFEELLAMLRSKGILS